MCRVLGISVRIVFCRRSEVAELILPEQCTLVSSAFFSVLSVNSACGTLGFADTALLPVSSTRYIRPCRRRTVSQLALSNLRKLAIVNTFNLSTEKQQCQN